MTSEGVHNRVKPGLVKNVPGWQLQLHPSLAGGTSPRFGTASQQQAGPGEKMAQVTSITATRVDAVTPVECQLATCLHASHALHAEVSKGGVLLFNEGPQVVSLPSKLQTELFILLLFLQLCLQGSITRRDCIQNTAPLFVHILQHTTKP